MLPNSETVWYILGAFYAFEIGWPQRCISVRHDWTTDGVGEGGARFARFGLG